MHTYQVSTPSNNIATISEDLCKDEEIVLDSEFLN